MMFSKNYFIVFILTFFVAGFFFMALPDKGYTQDVEEGCCRNALGNGGFTCRGCPTGCTHPIDDCVGVGNGVFTPDAFCVLTGGSQSAECLPILGCCARPDDQFPSGFDCEDGQLPSECEFPDPDQYFPGELCEDVPICQAPTGCCETPDAQNPTACFPLVTEADCDTRSGAWMQDVPCNGLAPPNGECLDDVVGCCSFQGTCFVETQEDCRIRSSGTVTIQPGIMCNIVGTCGTLGCCQEAGVTPNACTLTNFGDCVNDSTPENTWFANDSCNNDGDGGEICDFLIPGCCEFGNNGAMTEETTCEDTTMGLCTDGIFTAGDSCIDGTTCGTPPAGCCQDSIDPDICSDVTQFDCAEQSFFVDTACLSGEFCDAEGCCFLNVNGAAAASNRAVDPERCVEVLPNACSRMGGDFQGPATSCDDPQFAEQCRFPIVTSPIPTIGQWGLIAMAGLLGLFSLFIMIRRHRYNVG